MAAAKLIRLRQSEDFRACYQRGRMLKSGVVVLHVLPNGGQVTRVGFSVSKRLGKAVQRNRVRRRLRSIVQGYQLVPGYDVVIAARVRAKEMTFRELQQGVDALMLKAKILLQRSE